ncbi:hypothetical protein Dsin_001815 [Dipteronia sinensis]|uniref:Sororin C-terminal region domain-containing protein n=1 Tax=Dipteronia sinensis TaxID=43782 RepID=A0AAE0B638_9ROSI|nr:hypothetical protein Dsin_001815 [Dipteronia sinensis]
MEARRKRKALSDCTNTIVNTTNTSSSSSIKKPLTKPSIKPSLASAFKKVLANDSGKTVIDSNKINSKPGLSLAATDENGSESGTPANPSSSVVIAPTPRKSSLVSGDRGKTVIKSNSKPGSTSDTTNENDSESAAANPSSSAVVASTPRKSPLVSGTNEHDVVEPCSVYSRRRTSNRRKSKGKEVVSSPAISTVATRDNKKEDKVTGLPKSSTVRQKKKKEDDPVYDIPQDFIEKQRAYFAEVDSFELSEEEVDAFELSE